MYLRVLFSAFLCLVLNLSTIVFGGENTLEAKKWMVVQRGAGQDGIVRTKSRNFNGKDQVESLGSSRIMPRNRYTMYVLNDKSQVLISNDKLQVSIENQFASSVVLGLSHNQIDFLKEAYTNNGYVPCIKEIG